MPFRQVGQLREYGVSLFPVERQGLKAVGLEVSMPASAPHGLLLGHLQHRLAVPGVAHVLSKPQDVHMQPPQ